MLAILALVFSLKVYPLVSFAPSILTITIHVEPNANARSLMVLLSAEDSEFFRSSTLPMEGDKAPITNRIIWRDVPGGLYDISAALLGTSDVILETFVQHNVTVKGAF